MNKLLLHTCCGPCFLGVWEDLGKSDFEVTNYFYNPNIFPKEEFEKRLENLKKAAKNKSKLIIEEKYEPKDHAKAIEGIENDFPIRCLNCYRLRLDKTAKKAKKENFDYFSTTLLVSPYQNHEALKKIGEGVAEKYKVQFYYQDWRSFFRIGQEIAKESKIYRQKYCGCKYSREYR